MDNVYVVSGARTAVGKSGRGTLRNYRPDDMGGDVIREAVKRAGIQPGDVEDVMMGCALPEAEQGMNVARICALKAGLPDSVPAITINRFCSSGLQAIALAADRIRTGGADVRVGGRDDAKLERVDSQFALFSQSRAQCVTYVAVA